MGTKIHKKAAESMGFTAKYIPAYRSWEFTIGNDSILISKERVEEMPVWKLIKELNETLKNIE